MTIRIKAPFIRIEFEPQDTPIGMIIESQTRILTALSQSFAAAAGKEIGQKVGQQLAANLSPEQMLKLQKAIISDLASATEHSASTTANVIIEEIENHPLTTAAQEVINHTPGGKTASKAVKTLWKYSPAGIALRRLRTPSQPK